MGPGTKSRSQSPNDEDAKLELNPPGFKAGRTFKPSAQRFFKHYDLQQALMSRIIETLITRAATVCTGLWILKDMEMARNIADFKASNPSITTAIQSVDSLCGGHGSTKALQHAAYMAAVNRDPGEVMWQDSWNRLESMVKSLA